MPTTKELRRPDETLADLLERLGDIPASRVRLRPAPGSATEQDVVDIWDRERRRYELVEGTLVEKAMGIKESMLALWLGHLILKFLDGHDLGAVGGEAGPTRLVSGLVRMPDLAFFSWERLPNEEVPDVAVLDVAPDLAVEVVSRGNTRKELTRKLKEYFEAGVRLVWLVHPKTQTVEVYSGPQKMRRLSLRKNEALDGNAVLPGLKLSLRDVFEGMPQRRKRR